MQDKNTYNLFVKERRYRETTLLSYYLRPNKPIEKKCSPIDIDGERLQLDHTTGEVRNYKKKTILQNRNSSVARTRVLLNMLLELNDFDWFWTLTFDKERIDRTNANEVFKCYERYINNLSHKYRNFAYICIPELHKKRCYHFHILVKGISVKDMGLVNSGKVCCSWATYTDGIASKEYFERTKHLYTKVLTDTDGQTVYNITSFAYGFTTCTRIVSHAKCNNYVKKYIKKSLDSRFLEEGYRKRFFYSKNLNVPEVVTKLVGSGFTTPKRKIDSFDCVSSDPLFQSSYNKTFYSEHNILQCRVNNGTKELIERGIIPLSAEEINLEDIF